MTFKNGHTWSPAIVTEVSSYPRSYIITTPEGQTLCRNRKHLRQAHTNTTPEPSEHDEYMSSDGEDEAGEQGQAQCNQPEAD